MDSIYSQIILDAARSEKYRKPLNTPTRTEKGINASCGDKLELSLQIENGKIKAASFSGVGCAISLAATNLLLDEIVGKTTKEAEEAIENYLKALVGKPDNLPIGLLDSLSPSELHKILEPPALPETLEPLRPIRWNPARIKCVTLAARTLEKLLSPESQQAETE